MGTENNKTSVHGDSPEHREARGPRRAGTFAPLVFALAATLLSLGIGWLFFGLTYYNMDTISFMFQARLFAQGRLAADVPPDPGFSPSININIVNGKWYSKYPFGNALALALGVAAGAPWLVPAIATGGAIWFLYWILFDAHGRRTALLGCLLALISPSTLVLGGVGLSETVNRFFLSMFLFGVTRSVARPGWWYPALTGFSLGYAFNTKPLTAVAFGVCGAGYWLYSLRVDRRGLSRCIVTAAAPLVLMLTLFLAWNTYGTGSPWRMTHTALHRYDVLGFGRRSMVVPEPSYVYTPGEALLRVFTKTIPAVSHTTLGWGNYSPRFASSFVKGPWRSRFTIALSVSPLALLWLLAFLPLADRSRNRYDALFFSLPALTLFAYLFYYWEGAKFGSTPLLTRYYADAIMLGIIPLVGRGLQILYGRLKERTGTVARPIVAVCVVLLLANTAYSYVRFLGMVNVWGPVHRRLLHAVKARVTGRAVVFLPKDLDPQNEMPIGDYPFQNLQEAGIIFYRLGSLNTDADWRIAYKKYFQGRQAYLCRKGQLISLDPDRDT